THPRNKQRYLLILLSDNLLHGQKVDRAKICQYPCPLRRHDDSFISSDDAAKGLNSRRDYRVPFGATSCSEVEISPNEKSLAAQASELALAVPQSFLLRITLSSLRTGKRPARWSKDGEQFTSKLPRSSRGRTPWCRTTRSPARRR